MSAQLECDLYAPVKAYLESIGYEVKGEVGKCDAVGLRDDEMIAVEMKVAFGLPVIYQALQRLSSVDFVYIAVGVPDGYKARSNWDKQVPEATRLCRMLGVGLIAVRDGLVSILCEPSTYIPRKQPKMKARLLKEFKGRTGDYNIGGTTKRPRVTAYRENALRVASHLHKNGVSKASIVRDETGVPNASNILRDNVYNWFDKISTGHYQINSNGEQAIQIYADVIGAQNKSPV